MRLIDADKLLEDISGLYHDMSRELSSDTCANYNRGVGAVEELVGDTLRSMEAEKIRNPDPVNHPTHYTSGGIECIEAIEAALTPEEFRGFLKGNVMKYMWRTGLKNGQEDLEKGRWYLDRLIKRGENNES